MTDERPAEPPPGTDDPRSQEEKLRASHDLLASVLESPEDLVIFSLDTEYRYTAFNTNHFRTMQKIWGVEIEVGLCMLDVIKDPVDRLKAQDNFDRALGGEQFTRIESYGDRPNRFYYEDRYNPIVDSNGVIRGLTVFLTDITERLLQARELEQYRSRLENVVEERTRELKAAYESLRYETEERGKAEALLARSQRLDALGELAGGIAHDFNNILAAVVGYSDLILAQLPSVDHAPEFLEKIKGTAKHGSDLTSRLLAFSKRQVLQPSFLDLSELVASAAELLQRLLPRSIVLETQLERPLPSIKADRTGLEQVVVNLVLNARDAMPEGGTITLSTAVAPNGQVSAAVTDEGVGMTPEILEQIFDPFFSTRASGSGAGLGLSMVYGIVEQHEGTLDVQSTPGEGSRFEVRFPAVLEPEPPRPVREPTPTDEPRFTRPRRSTPTGARVLLVEDDEALANMARTVLERNGYEVEAASTSEAALYRWTEVDGAVDVLFCDIVLPDRDGVSLALDLVARKPSLAVLLTSGFREAGLDVRELEGLSNYRFLAKPYERQALLEELARLLGRDPV